MQGLFASPAGKILRLGLGAGLEKTQNGIEKMGGVWYDKEVKI